MSDKVTKKRATFRMLETWLEGKLDFSLYSEEADCPGCCSTNIIHGFKNDEQIQEYIDDCFADFNKEYSGITKARFVEAFKAELVDQFKYSDYRGGSQCEIALLADYQDLAKSILIGAGFVLAGTYPGDDCDTMSVLVGGLTRARR